MHHEIIPNDHRSRLVEGYWEATTEGGLLLPPDGTLHVLYTPSDAFLYHQGVARPDILGAGLHLLPIQTQALRIHGPERLLGIRFKAFAAPTLPAHGVAHLADQVESGCAGMALHDSLPVLESLCDQLIPPGKVPASPLRDKVNFILEHRGAVKVQDLELEFGVSRQAVHKEFVRGIGIGPKALADIWRFNHFLSLMQSVDSMTYAALDAGYYDQAHGIRDFRHRVGAAPSELRRSPSWSWRFALECIQRRFGHRYDPV